MTASSPTGATNSRIGSTNGKARQNQSSSTNQTSCPVNNSSATFQQIKQTQASLARLCRVQQLNIQNQPQPSNQQASSHHNQSSQSNQQQQQVKPSSSDGNQQQQQQRFTTFVDCLIRRFKNCFSEDFCTVPMFVVGNLSPGSDGTHLILPPCVSLGRQNINRFSSPKNLRLMNSIRESCRSIEELDLGGNKLTDLIEVYKILQCTPNLRFLNLSENDLSKTSPVAMASSTTASCPTTTSSLLTTANNSAAFNSGSPPSTTTTNLSAIQSNNSGTSTGTSPSWQSSALNLRSCLAPINQNHQPPGIGPRRHHSTLGQPTATATTATTTTTASTSVISTAGLPNATTTSGRCPTFTSSPTAATTSSPNARVRPAASRVAEARRLAAANALAQSKKTSSIVASKLANSAAAANRGSVPGSGRNFATTSRASNSATISSKQSSLNSRLSGSSQRHQTHGTTSTMCLARSLSSLSAKDIRATGRLTAAHRSSVMKESAGKSQRIDRRASLDLLKQSTGGKQQQPHSSANEEQMAGDHRLLQKNCGNSSKLTTSLSHQGLSVEPIAETEDVDMVAEQQQQQQQQLSPSGQQTHSSAGKPSLQPTTGFSSPASTANNKSNYVMNSSTQISSSSSSATSNTSYRRTFESIKALALNNTGCQWRVVCSILSRMPNLEELHLSLNDYKRIDLDVNEFKHHSLKRLYLCNNPKLTDWEELDKLLIAFPSLEALSIANCNISQIPENLDRSREWRKLCGLNINGWPIKEWPVVDRLNQLPSLIDLRCRNLEVLQSIDEPRHHLIARLPKLQRLNGSEIEEREDAEKAFLRFFMANSHLERPERFHELIQIHGEVAKSVDVDVDLSPPSHASVRVIYLNRNYFKKENEDDILMSEDFLIKLMDNADSNGQAKSSATDEAATTSNENDDASTLAGNTNNNEQPVRLFKDEGQEVVAIDIDLRQSVRKFKSTIAALFGLESQNLILYYIDHEMVGLMGPELIKHNQKKLWNYNVQDGDQFIVEER